MDTTTSPAKTLETTPLSATKVQTAAFATKTYKPNRALNRYNIATLFHKWTLLLSQTVELVEAFILIVVCNKTIVGFVK